MAKPPPSEAQIGRLAMRQEGDYWNAYYAMPDSMDEAQFLGSIHMAFIVNNQDAKQMFMDVMRECVADIVEESAGIRPTWGGPTSAPEHEKAGNA